MASEPQVHDEQNDSVFDVTKLDNGIKFLGLLDRPSVSDNKPTGLFDWVCPACGAANRDAVVIEAQQAFLGHWSCETCARSHVVRFRARASAEWIAGHTLAVTGSALCHLVEDDRLTQWTPANPPRRRTGSQRAFAWISVPVLLTIIVLALTGRNPLSHSSAALSSSEPVPSTPLTAGRLAGTWVGPEGGDRLYFGRLDPVSRAGRFIRFPQGRAPGRRGWFSVIHEDVTGEQLVVKHWSEGAAAGPSGSEVMVHIPRQARSLTWVGVQNGAPVLRHYRRADPADQPLP